MKITNRPEPFGIDVKRFGFGCTVESACPECGRVVTHDYGKGRYLSYPAMNKVFDLWFAHEHLDETTGEYSEHEWAEPVILRVQLDPAVRVQLDPADSGK